MERVRIIWKMSDSRLKSSSPENGSSVSRRRAAEGRGLLQASPPPPASATEPCVPPGCRAVLPGHPEVPAAISSGAQSMTNEISTGACPVTENDRASRGLVPPGGPSLPRPAVPRGWAPPGPRGAAYRQNHSPGEGGAGVLNFWPREEGMLLSLAIRTFHLDRRDRHVHSERGAAPRPRAGPCGSDKRAPSRAGQPLVPGGGRPGGLPARPRYRFFLCFRDFLRLRIIS